MEYYFKKVLAAVDQDTCYSQYAEYELTITQAVKLYNLYLVNRESDLADLYKQAFMDECANGACQNATAALLGALTGNSGLFGCDMLNILYYGDVKNGYYQGWRDNVTTKGAYLLSLANMGVVVQSAFLTLETGSSSAYTVVSSLFDKDVVAAAKRIKQFDDWCIDD